jgi:ribosomal protein L37E
MFLPSESPDRLDCPRCGKRVLVKRNHDEYHCLWCGFYRNLNYGSMGNWGPSPFFFIMLLVIFLIVMFA